MRVDLKPRSNKAEKDFSQVSQEKVCVKKDWKVLQPPRRREDWQNLVTA